MIYPAHNTAFRRRDIARLLRIWDPEAKSIDKALCCAAISWLGRDTSTSLWDEMDWTVGPPGRPAKILGVDRKRGRRGTDPARWKQVQISRSWGLLRICADFFGATRKICRGRKPSMAVMFSMLSKAPPRAIKHPHGGFYVFSAQAMERYSARAR